MLLRHLQKAIIYICCEFVSLRRDYNQLSPRSNYLIHTMIHLAVVPRRLRLRYNQLNRFIQVNLCAVFPRSAPEVASRPRHVRYDQRVAYGVHHGRPVLCRSLLSPSRHLLWRGPPRPRSRTDASSWSIPGVCRDPRKGSRTRCVSSARNSGR